MPIFGVQINYQTRFSPFNWPNLFVDILLAARIANTAISVCSSPPHEHAVPVLAAHRARTEPGDSGARFEHSEPSPSPPRHQCVLCGQELRGAFDHMGQSVRHFSTREKGRKARLRLASASWNMQSHLCSSKCLWCYGCCAI